jgi:hypothetical protein
MVRAAQVLRAVSAALDKRKVKITPDMLNSAGSVGAEWYVEALWHYLSKRSQLQGISAVDVEFSNPALPSDRELLFSPPKAQADDFVMGFHVLRAGTVRPARVAVPVATVRVHRARRRSLAAEAPDPPLHPFGIEIRARHLNQLRQVSWHTMIAMTMDVARRGSQLADAAAVERVDPTRQYVVPRFSFTPLADAAAQPNLFVYPDFSLTQSWAGGRTSVVARVTIWAVAHEDPWPLASSLVTVVRTAVVGSTRRPVDEAGIAVQKRRLR